MDYRKLDAALGRAVGAGGGHPGTRDLLVLVRLTEPPSDEQLEQLRQAGVNGTDTRRTVLTGTLSRQDVETLSEQPWVLSLSLSGSRRPLPGVR
ncbi:hypothetical protein ABT084_08505 [Streptomyces sp. NPDC002138]|uniref:hypothetical protein n=1 Tax=Streptomyces sp. NPDC002138 TaxID=3154410 RepID=UPI00331B7514